MTIEIKGTRTPETPLSGAERYASRIPARRSGVPYHAALAVAAISAFLRSIFGPPAEAKAPPPENPETGTPGRGSATPLVADDPQDAAREHVPPKSTPSLPAASPSAVYEPIADATFEMPSTLRIHDLRFARPNPVPDLGDFKASPVIPNPTNDNAGSRIGEGGGGGGGQGQPRPVRVVRSSDDDAPSEAHAPAPPAQGTGITAPSPAPNAPDGGPGDRRNRPPVVDGPVYLGQVTGCALLQIGLADFLRGASDPDGDALVIRDIRVSSGAIAVEDQSWVFDGDMPGRVAITYTISDGESAVTQTAYVDVIDRSILSGTDGDDRILGTLCADDVSSGLGDDDIDARSGDDVVVGGDGDDVVFAGAGSDVVSGGMGNDRLFGEAGNDVLFGDAGDDLLDGGEGDDILFGGVGNDVLLGDAGDDRLDGGDGDDRLLAGAGSDVLSGGAGSDVLEGGDGNDVLADGSGSDVVSGGMGDDTIVVAADGDADAFDGGDGRDTLDLAAIAEAVTVDLAEGTVAGAATGPDTVALVEIVVAGSGDDTLRGGDQADTLSGGGGDDTIAGASGDDRLVDGNGSDTVSGGSGNDTIVMSLDGEADAFDGGEDCDTLDLSAATEAVEVDLVRGTVLGAETGSDTVASIEIVLSGSGSDVIRGSVKADMLSGGGGDDTIAGAAGDDRLVDGTGSDTISGGSGDDTIVVSLDGEADAFDGGEDRDTLDLSAATEAVEVDLVRGTVLGTETGSDTVASIEIVLSGSGSDVLRGNVQADVLSGGGGDDTIAGASGDDRLVDGAGFDTVSGGSGDDTIVVSLDGEADAFDGGEDCDTLDLSAATEAVEVDLVRGTVLGAETGSDTVASIEIVVSGAGNDILRGGAEHDTLIGGDGDDILADGTGCDVVQAGRGNDLVIVTLDEEIDVFDGGEGQDTIDFSSIEVTLTIDRSDGYASSSRGGRDRFNDFESVRSGSGNDVIRGGASDETLDGGAGDDELSDGSGRDVVRGGRGDDRILVVLDRDDDIFDGGDGRDTLDLSHLTGDLVIDLEAGRINGRDLGDDTETGFEAVVAGRGDDIFIVVRGDFDLTGGEGSDAYVFRAPTSGRDATLAARITDFAIGDQVELLGITLFDTSDTTTDCALANALQGEQVISGLRWQSGEFEWGKGIILDVDLDGDDRFETTIVLSGEHALAFSQLSQSGSETQSVH